MTSTAFFYRATWRAKREYFFNWIGENRNSDGPVLLFGGKRFDSVAKPEVWMPRVYLAFKATHRDMIFDWSVRGVAHYPDRLEHRLCDDVGKSLPVRAPFAGTYVGAFRSMFRGMPTLDLVFERGYRDRHIAKVTRQVRIRVLPSQLVREGDIVAHDGPEHVPDGWNDMSLYKKWKHVLSSLVCWKPYDWIRLWFERQFVKVGPKIGTARLVFVYSQPTGPAFR